MSSFTTSLKVEIPTAGKKVILLEEFTYHIGSEDSDIFITVPAGFRTDLASTPFFSWSLGFPRWGRYSKAAVLHDHCYSLNLHNRKWADGLFYEAMLVSGTGLWKAKVMYLAVRLFGWIAWNKHKNKIYPLHPLLQRGKF